MAIDARGFDLTGVGQLSGGLGRALAGGQQLQRAAAQEMRLQQAERGEKIRQLLGGAQPTEQQQLLAEQSIGLGEDEAISQAKPTEAQLMEQAIKIDPILARKQFEAIGIDSASKRAEASRFAAQVQSVPPEMQNRLIQERAQNLKAEGRDPKDTLELLDMPPAQRNQALTGVQLMDLATKDRITARERIAKGLEKESISEVQSSKILPGGVVQIVRKDGTIETKAPDEVAKDVVERAEDRGVNLQQRRAQGRGLGKDAAKVAAEATKQVGSLRSNNATLKQVINEVRGGAETGPLSAKLPSFRAESVRLETLRNKLGLDVVGAVTFGALSEGELNLALGTALPTKLDGPELVKWAEDKISAQEKMAKYLEDQAIFLSKSGSTPAMWLEQQRERAEAAPESGTTVQQVGRFQVRVK